jgi:tRNA(adenine34) deaminase
MERCLELALIAMDRGEYPYAAAISRAGEIVCEAVNSVKLDHDVTHHAELMALAGAFKILGRTSIDDCTIYSSAEPYALCSYAIRESRVGRVVYGIPAPLTGGLSR